MTANYLKLDADFAKAEIAKLFEACPDLAEDEELRRDMVEGETGAMRVFERAIDIIRDKTIVVAGVEHVESELSARKQRAQNAIDATRRMIRSLMRAASLDKVELPTATMFVTKAKNSVGIESVEDLPQGFVKITREANKAEIKKELEAGSEVPGAFLVLGEPGLTIRTK